MRHQAWTIGGLAAVALFAAACGSSGSGAGSMSSSTPAQSASSGSTGAAASAVLKTRTTSLGIVVTDAKGHTLYWYAPDTSTTSKCAGECATAWPPVTGTPTAASGVSLPGRLSTITRSDGTLQVTYAGHPLYRYEVDTAPGKTTGDGVGGTWHAMRVTGAAAPSSPSSSGSTSGGGGYGY